MKRYQIAIAILIFLLMIPAIFGFSGYIYKVGDKISIGRYSNDFDGAITAIGSSNYTLVIDTNITVTQDVTVPATCGLDIGRGGSLTYQDANVDLTINGPVHAGPYQWIDPNRAWVTFGTGAVTVGYCEWFGGAGDNSTDNHTAIERIVATGVPKVDFVDGTYLSSDVISWASNVDAFGKGVIKAQVDTEIGSLIYMTNLTNIDWSVDIDMAQDANSVDADDICSIGININDSDDIILHDFEISNVREGRPIYIDGTSSSSPASTDGSTNIHVSNITCEAYDYDTVDVGAYIVIRSDFYTDTAGGTCYSSSNATKTADFAVDPNYTYTATTKHIYFDNCYFKKFDRIGLYNVEDVHFNNCTLDDFYTRGYNISPTCSYITVTGGKINHGSASLIGCAYVCKYCNFSDISVYGEESVGEKATLKTYYGCSDINFSNISGVGTPTAHIYVHSSKRIHFNNISLRKASAGTTRIIDLRSGPNNNSATYVTEDITVENSSFEGSYAMFINYDIGTGTTTFGLPALKVHNCTFDKTSELFHGSYTPSNGEVEFCFNRADVSGSAQDLESQWFTFFIGNNIQCDFTKQITPLGREADPNFADLYWFVPERDGGSGNLTRNPGVMIFQNGHILAYGEDYYIDANNDGVMNCAIHMVDPNAVNGGDVLTAIRQY